MPICHFSFSEWKERHCNRHHVIPQYLGRRNPFYTDFVENEYNILPAHITVHINIHALARRIIRELPFQGQEVPVASFWTVTQNLHRFRDLPPNTREMVRSNLINCLGNLQRSGLMSDISAEHPWFLNFQGLEELLKTECESIDYNVVFPNLSTSILISYSKTQ